MLIAALALTTAGCGGTKTIVETVTGSGSSTSGTSTGSGTGTSATPRRASLGDSLTLTGNSGEQLAVTVQRIADPEPGGQFDQPDAGTRYIGVFVTLRNVGTVAYNDSPSNGATLISAAGQQANGTLISGGDCSNGFASSTKIEPGGFQTGCLPFQMPLGQAPATFQFALSSGFADKTGQWDVSGRSSGGTATGTSTGTATGTSTGTSTGSSAPSGFTPCDQNISAGSGTSCPFAENVFRSVANGYQHNGGNIPGSVSAFSPTTSTTYQLSCNVNAGTVLCTSTTGATVTFPVHAVAVY